MLYYMLIQDPRWKSVYPSTRMQSTSTQKQGQPMQRTNISMADRTTNRAKTARDAGLWAAIQAADQAAIKYEGEWGIGRLERIVPPELAAKFAIARHQLDEAIMAVDIELAGQKAMAMARGWEALDKAAEAGYYSSEYRFVGGLLGAQVELGSWRRRHVWQASGV